MMNLVMRKRVSLSLLATDLDCDRVGVAVRDKDDFVLLTGNQVGCLLLNYVCERRVKLGTMPKNPVMSRPLSLVIWERRLQTDTV